MDKKKIFDYATQGIKDRIMGNEQNNERGKHAETIIRNHVIWACGAGFIPIPAADVLAVSALQLDMIRALCRVYDINFSETQGKAIVTSLTSSTVARLGAASVTKLIPVIGSMIGGLTNSVFAGASTYALGEVFKKHFEAGGTILDFDPERVKKLYKEKFEKGKKVAQNLQRQQREQDQDWAPDTHFRPGKPAGGDETKTPPPAADSPKGGTDIVAKIRELATMRDEGIITEEEFQEMKRKVINRE